MTNQELVVVIKKNPISIGCGVLSLALIATLYFRSDLKAQAEAELAEKSRAGERYAANIKNSAQLDEDFKQLSAANKEIESRAVVINELGVNSQFFYKLEGETGVKLIDFRQTTQSGTKGKTAFLPVGFAVSVQGNLAQLLHFLRLLESGAHYCRVNTAAISANTAMRGNPLTLSLNLEMLGTP